MFNGIIRYQGIVASFDQRSGVLVVHTRPQSRAVVGSSVAVNGVCLTVEKKKKGHRTIFFTLMPETLRATTLGDLRKGDRVNLEEPLRVGEKIDGHIVLGHIDGVASVRNRKKERTSILLTVRAPRRIARYIAAKGSITLDGVGLTVVSVRGSAFTVSLNPYTLEATTLGVKRIRDTLNIEVDILARYIARIRGL